MNKVEEVKAAKDLLSIGEELPAFARMGWENIPDADRDTRLKWWGVFHRQQTPGYFMIRIRIPNGIATAEQIHAIGDITNRLGRGTLDLTTRQQIQLRWLRIEDIPEAVRILNECGLLTLQTGHDNIRGIMGCPVAGLTPNELFDASPVVRAFSDLIIGNREFVNMPRKFNVTITGCFENCTHAESQDIGMVPATKDMGGRTVNGFNVLVGGKMGSGGFRLGRPLDAFVSPDEAPSVAAAIALIFRDHGQREVRNRARLCFLIDEWGMGRFRREVESRAGLELARAGDDARTAAVTDHIGAYKQRQDGLNYVGLLVPVGRATGDQLIALARLATLYGNGEVRLTPGQNVIVAGVPQHRLQAMLDEPLLRDLRYAPSDIMRGTVSCTGTDYCGLATIETKTHALNLIRALDDGSARSRPVTVNWSGCPAGCGNHQASDIGLLGRKKKIDGEIVEAVDVFVGGAGGADGVPGVKVLEGVPCDKLAPVVEKLVRYGAFKALRRQLTRSESPEGDE